MIKSFQENLLNNVVLRGIHEIENVTLRKIHNYLSYNEETGDFDKKDVCVLDTLGSNLQHILSLDYIDVNRTYSNNIIEMQEHLGIEAARKCLFKEICDVMEFDGGYINYHHIGLLCDRMTCNKKLVSIFRHGINNDNIGPIAKASFEETSEMFLKAARHGELDEMCGVSANIMCGQQGFFGTGACSIYLNTVELQNMQKEVEIEEEEEDIFDMMKAEVNDACTIDKLKIKHNLDDLAIDKARDNDYSIDI
jgi:DNA-directed RNA polymerase II subunit RPB1